MIESKIYAGGALPFNRVPEQLIFRRNFDDASIKHNDVNVYRHSALDANCTDIMHRSTCNAPIQTLHVIGRNNLAADFCNALLRGNCPDTCTAAVQNAKTRAICQC